MCKKYFFTESAITNMCQYMCVCCGNSTCDSTIMTEQNDDCSNLVLKMMARFWEKRKIREEGVTKKWCCGNEPQGVNLALKQAGNELDITTGWELTWHYNSWQWTWHYNRLAVNLTLHHTVDFLNSRSALKKQPPLPCGTHCSLPRPPSYPQFEALRYYYVD